MKNLVMVFMYTFFISSAFADPKVLLVEEKEGVLALKIQKGGVVQAIPSTDLILDALGEAKSVPESCPEKHICIDIGQKNPALFTLYKGTPYEETLQFDYSSDTNQWTAHSAHADSQTGIYPEGPGKIFTVDLVNRTDGISIKFLDKETGSPAFSAPIVLNEECGVYAYKVLLSGSVRGDVKLKLTPPTGTMKVSTNPPPACTTGGNNAEFVSYAQNLSGGEQQVPLTPGSEQILYLIALDNAIFRRNEDVVVQQTLISEDAALQNVTIAQRIPVKILENDFSDVKLTFSVPDESGSAPPVEETTSAPATLASRELNTISDNLVFSINGQEIRSENITKITDGTDEITVSFRNVQYNPDDTITVILRDYADNKWDSVDEELRAINDLIKTAYTGSGSGEVNLTIALQPKYLFEITGTIASLPEGDWKAGFLDSTTGKMLSEGFIDRNDDGTFSFTLGTLLRGDQKILFQSVSNAAVKYSLDVNIGSTTVEVMGFRNSESRLFVAGGEDPTSFVINSPETGGSKYVNIAQFGNLLFKDSSVITLKPLVYASGKNFVAPKSQEIPLEKIETMSITPAEGEAIPCEKKDDSMQCHIPFDYVSSAERTYTVQVNMVAGGSFTEPLNLTGISGRKKTIALTTQVAGDVPLSEAPIKANDKEEYALPLHLQTGVNVSINVEDENVTLQSLNAVFFTSGQNRSRPENTSGLLALESAQTANSFTTYFPLVNVEENPDVFVRMVSQDGYLYDAVILKSDLETSESESEFGFIVSDEATGTITVTVRKTMLRGAVLNAFGAKAVVNGIELSESGEVTLKPENLYFNFAYEQPSVKLNADECRLKGSVVATIDLAGRKITAVRSSPSEQEVISVDTCQFIESIYGKGRNYSTGRPDLFLFKDAGHFKWAGLTYVTAQSLFPRSIIDQSIQSQSSRSIFNAHVALTIPNEKLKEKYIESAQNYYGSAENQNPTLWYSFGESQRVLVVPVSFSISIDEDWSPYVLSLPRTSGASFSADTYTEVTTRGLWPLLTYDPITGLLLGDVTLARKGLHVQGENRFLYTYDVESYEHDLNRPSGSGGSLQIDIIKEDETNLNPGDNYTLEIESGMISLGDKKLKFAKTTLVEPKVKEGVYRDKLLQGRYDFDSCDIERNELKCKSSGISRTVEMYKGLDLVIHTIEFKTVMNSDETQSLTLKGKIATDLKQNQPWYEALIGYAFYDVSADLELKVSIGTGESDLPPLWNKWEGEVKQNALGIKMAIGLIPGLENITRSINYKPDLGFFVSGGIKLESDVSNGNSASGSNGGASSNLQMEYVKNRIKYSLDGTEKFFEKKKEAKETKVEIENFLYVAMGQKETEAVFVPKAQFNKSIGIGPKKVVVAFLFEYDPVNEIVFKGRVQRHLGMLDDLEKIEKSKKQIKAIMAVYPDKPGSKKAGAFKKLLGLLTGTEITNKAREKNNEATLAEKDTNSEKWHLEIIANRDFYQVKVDTSFLEEWFGLDRESVEDVIWIDNIEYKQFYDPEKGGHIGFASTTGGFFSVSGTIPKGRNDSRFSIAGEFDGKDFDEKVLQGRELFGNLGKISVEFTQNRSFNPEAPTSIEAAIGVKGISLPPLDKPGLDDLVTKNELRAQALKGAGGAVVDAEATEIDPGLGAPGAYIKEAKVIVKYVTATDLNVTIKGTLYTHFGLARWNGRVSVGRGVELKQERVLEVIDKFETPYAKNGDGLAVEAGVEFGLPPTKVNGLTISAFLDGNASFLIAEATFTAGIVAMASASVGHQLLGEYSATAKIGTLFAIQDYDSKIGIIILGEAIAEHDDLGKASSSKEWKALLDTSK